MAHDDERALGAEGSAQAGHDVHSARPRPDDSPPQNRLIFFYAVLVVSTLIGLKFVMDSFLDASRRDVQRSHLVSSVSNERLAEHRARERDALHAGPRRIDDVIREIAQRGRGAYPQIRPYPSTDRGALEGWNRRGPAEAPPVPEPAVR